MRVGLHCNTIFITVPDCHLVFLGFGEIIMFNLNLYTNKSYYLIFPLIIRVKKTYDFLFKLYFCKSGLNILIGEISPSFCCKSCFQWVLLFRTDFNNIIYLFPKNITPFTRTALRKINYRRDQLRDRHADPFDTLFRLGLQ